MYKYSFNDLKFTLKRLKRSYTFRSYDLPQGTYIVPCYSYSLKTLSDIHRLRWVGAVAACIMWVVYCSEWAWLWIYEYMCICWCINEINYRMHGTTIYIQEDVLFRVNCKRNRKQCSIFVILCFSCGSFKALPNAVLW